jgi:hypothetical protein
MQIELVSNVHRPACTRNRPDKLENTCRLHHAGKTPKPPYFGRLKGCASVLLTELVQCDSLKHVNGELTAHSRPN